MAYHPDLDPNRKDEGNALRDKIIPNLRYAFLFMALNIAIFVGYILGLLPENIALSDLLFGSFLLTVGAAVLGVLGKMAT